MYMAKFVFICAYPAWGSQNLHLWIYALHYLYFCFYFFWPHHMACGISVPRPWIKLGPRQWKGGVLTPEALGNSLYSSLSLENLVLDDFKCFAAKFTLSSTSSSPIMHMLCLFTGSHVSVRVYVIFYHFFRCDSEQIFSLNCFWAHTSFLLLLVYY